MNLIVDSNILFCFFWQNSVTKSILRKTKASLFSPEFALTEIQKHKTVLCKKTGVSLKEFQKQLLELSTIVTFFSVEDYKKQLKEALTFSPDPNDIDFFALALRLNAPLWSNDARLKQQHKVFVMNTKELLSMKGMLLF